MLQTAAAHKGPVADDHQTLRKCDLTQTGAFFKCRGTDPDDIFGEMNGFQLLAEALRKGDRRDLFAVRAPRGVIVIIIIEHGASAGDGQNAGILVEAPGQVFAADVCGFRGAGGDRELRDEGQQQGQGQQRGQKTGPFLMFHGRFSFLLFRTCQLMDPPFCGVSRPPRRSGEDGAENRTERRRSPAGLRRRWTAIRPGSFRGSELSIRGAYCRVVRDML